MDEAAPPEDVDAAAFLVATRIHYELKQRSQKTPASSVRPARTNQSTDAAATQIPEDSS